MKRRGRGQSNALVYRFHARMYNLFFCTASSVVILYLFGRGVGGGHRRAVRSLRRRPRFWLSVRVIRLCLLAFLPPLLFAGDNYSATTATTTTTCSAKSAERAGGVQGCSQQAVLARILGIKVPAGSFGRHDYQLVSRRIVLSLLSCGVSVDFGPGG